MKRAQLSAWLLGLALVAFCAAVVAAQDAAAAQNAAPAPDAVADTLTAEAALAVLAAGDRAGTGAALDALLRSDAPFARRALAALEVGDLYRLRRGSQLVVGTRQGRQYELIDVLTGQALPPVGRRDVRSVRMTNAMRAQLQSLRALAGLAAPAPEARAAAAAALAGQLDAQGLARLRRIARDEPDAAARRAMEVVLAIEDLQAPDAAVQLAAVEQLSGEVSVAARSALNTLAGNAATPALAQAAARALQATERKLQLFGWIETLFFGLSMGSVLVLAAIGLAITFGVMGVINMAHGELMMLGAYTTYTVQLLLPEQLALSLLVALPLAFAVTALVGIAIERGIIRHLYGRPLETLLATFGVSLILQQAVRSIFSPLNRSVATPEFMQGSFEIVSGLSLTWSRLYIFGFSMAVFAGLLLLLSRTRTGLEIRAVAQNRRIARALGVRSGRVDALTFGLGAGIAGVAGVALSQLTNVGPNMGQAYIIDSFLVVVFGGVGNLWGTLVGGLSLGVLSKVLEPATGAVLAKVLMLLFVIAFIQRRPRGLFPPQGRAAGS